MNIYLTLDYELYMGAQSGSVKNCLIRPMNELIERTKDLNVHFTVFADAAYLYKLAELKNKHISLQKDFDEISTQLRSLVSQGHSVQLHIHPQWYFSTYENGGWEIDQSHYKMSDIPADKLNDLFAKSKKLLEDIIGKEVTAFRAGGYSLQSLENYADFLSQNGIMADSSAASGQKYISDYQWYDYSQVCGNRVYRFSTEIANVDSEGILIEYPISSIRISTFRYILYRLYLKFFKEIGKPYGDGKAVPSNQSVNLLETRVMNYSFDYVMAPMLCSAFKKMKKTGYHDVVLIGHPKNQSTESIEELRKFILKTRDAVTFETIN